MSDIWKLMRFLARVSRDIRFAGLLVSAIVVTGILSGFANTGMIVVINSFLSQDELTIPKLGWAFAGLCIALPILRLVSQALLIGLSRRATFALRMKLCRQILDAPLPHLEKLGQHRLLANLTNDVGRLTESLAVVPLIFMHFAIVAGCLAYMGYLSGSILLQLLLFMTIGIATYQLPLIRAVRRLNIARDIYDGLYKDFRALTEGTKELKMHVLRRSAFLADAEVMADKHRRETQAGDTIFAAASSWGQTLFFVFIGLLLFVMPQYQELTQAILIGYTLTIFHMMTPLELILNEVPNLSRAVISMKKIDKLTARLAEKTTEAIDGDAAGAKASWQRLELASVTHTYYQEAVDEQFLMGPIDLAFEPGELVVVVGGNGSGKTTLAKIIIGLYPPEAGDVLLDGERIDDDNRDRYRQNFSVVFSDFFLFEKLLGITHPEVDEKAEEYLRELHLENKVKIENGELSTIDLSQGQRKRLALLTAYLEDRQIYLFDEWAADQDPQFKEIFYYSLLPSLRARGKTVLVISHDDHYYRIADRVIKLDYGRIEYDGSYEGYLRAMSAGVEEPPAPPSPQARPARPESQSPPAATEEA